MSEPTAGPWEWYNGCSWWRLGVAGDQARHDAVLCPVMDQDGHANLRCSAADKALIQAAPDLLAALEAITELLERVGDNRKDAPFLDAANAAIAKARGLTR